MADVKQPEVPEQEEADGPAISDQQKEDYMTWKKNAPFLYDVVMTHDLEWPSLTAQWLPDKVEVRDPENPDKDHSIQRLILGTHTSGLNEKNYLMIAQVRLPLEDTPIDNRTEGQEGKEGEGGYGGASGKVEVVQRILHEGEVNRARFMPQNPNLIATKNPGNHVLLFDRTAHDSNTDKSSSSEECSPELRLVGHTKEGFGLCWNPLLKGHLASASDDTTVCIWNIDAATKKKSELPPLLTLRGHTDVVEDVAWHLHNQHYLGSCGDDRSVLLWDTRADAKPKHTIANAHTSEVNCLSFNPEDEFRLVTGGADHVVAVWDLRNLKTPVLSFDTHTDQVMGVSWAPFSGDVFASFGADRRVNVWDLTRTGANLDDEDKTDGPPELLFIHSGHMDKLADLSWNANDPWVMATVADDNVLQVWQMAENIYCEDDEGDEGEAEITAPATPAAEAVPAAPAATTGFFAAPAAPAAPAATAGLAAVPEEAAAAEAKEGAAEAKEGAAEAEAKKKETQAGEVAAQMTTA